MLSAVVIQLIALDSGFIRAATGTFVHGFWLHHWHAVAPEIGDALHGDQALQPFTVSPLMGLALPHRGQISVTEGTKAWIRVTTLGEPLTTALHEAWLPALPAVITLGRRQWQVTGWTADADPWAGRCDPYALAEAHLLGRHPSDGWRLRFTTPTTFHGEAGHLPFPMPRALVGSWLRRWEAFGPIRLPGDALLEAVQTGLAISAYRLKTVPMRDRERLTIGCVGELRLRATGLGLPTRAALDLLAAFAFWSGSGYHTTQGFGMTRPM
ncbi:MAG: CRISPR system precrRNA processing endoribonuclease RAMP protein Cas6 [Anaerolineae bacterium]